MAQPHLAAEAYRQAAAAGLPTAVNNLATLHMHGRGVAKDKALAMQLYRQVRRALGGLLSCFMEAFNAVGACAFACRPRLNRAVPQLPTTWPALFSRAAAGQHASARTRHRLPQLQSQTAESLKAWQVLLQRSPAPQCPSQQPQLIRSNARRAWLQQC